MRQIERYILRRVVSPTLSTLVVTTVMVLVTQLLIRINLITQTGQSLLVFGKLAMALTPWLAMMVLPFALLVGVTRTLNTMNTDSEIVVMESSGCSPATIARPVILFAAVLSVVSLATALYVAPVANRYARTLINEASADLLRSVVQTGSFTRLDANTFVQIAEELPGGDFGGIVLVDTRDPNFQNLYYAQRGSLQKADGRTFLVLANGEVHRKDEKTGEVSIVTFTTTALDFAQFAPGSGRGGYMPQEYLSADLFSPPADDPLARDHPGWLRIELNRRMSDWLYPLLFGLIAVYFVGGAHSHRQDRMMQLGTAMVIALLLRGVSYFTVNNSGDSTFYAVLTYGVPLGAIVVFGIGLVTGISLRPPQWLSDRVEQLFSIATRPLAMLMRRFGNAGGGAGAKP